MTTVHERLVLGWLCLAIAQWAPVTAMADDAAGSGPPPQADAVYVDLRVPLGADQFADTPVALVNDEPITLRELTHELASMHAAMAPGTAPGKATYTGMLERLVGTRLILLEAENIGLQDRYGITAQVDQFADKLLRQQVMRRALEDVHADDAAVDKLYQRMARAVKLDVLRFKDGEAAKRFEQEIANGGDFAKVAQDLVDGGKATLEPGADYLKLKDLREQLAKAVIDMPIGAVSPVFQDESGFLAFRLTDARGEEDAGVKAEARRIVLHKAREEEVTRYGRQLIKKHAHVDEGLLKGLDFEVTHTGLFGLGKTKPVDFATLLEDKRVLATVTGDPPVTLTVGDLARELQAKLYHGPAKAAAFGRLNEHKEEAFENMVFKLAAKREAIEQGIDQSEEYRAAVDNYRRSVLFGAFIQKVVAPEVTLSEDEVRGYYDAHLGDYATPPMVKMRSLAFADRRSAEDAAAKLKRGTDFTWVSANVRGQVDKDAKDLLPLDNRLLTLSSLPAGMGDLVAGARDGDVLIYGSPEGYSYVLVVNQMVPATPQPYDQVRGEISKVVFNEKLKVAVDGWVEKLKQAYDTKIFVTGFDL